MRAARSIFFLALVLSPQIPQYGDDSVQQRAGVVLLDKQQPDQLSRHTRGTRTRTRMGREQDRRRANPVGEG